MITDFCRDEITVYQRLYYVHILSKTNDKKLTSFYQKNHDSFKVAIYT